VNVQQITTSTTSGVTMTSREIAQLTMSSHDNVLKTIRRLVGEGVVSSNETPYRSEQNGQLYPEFLLSFRDTMVLVSGYSAQLRAAIIDRWQELESAVPAPAFAIPTSLSGALRLAAEQADVIEAQAAQLAAAAPAVEFVERYVDASGTAGFRQVCKILNANENVFREFLLNKKIAYRLGNELTPHADHLHAGRFQVKAGTAVANGHAFNSMRFTTKGITWIAGEFAKHQLQMAHH
jgi:phage antirepressor YoqD-like protein